MISLTRPHTAPDVLQARSTVRRRAESKIRKMIAAGEVPQSKDFEALWTKSAVREKLVEMHNGRCCYCERIRDKSRESDIEHFRPKTEVSDKTPPKPGYWWLAYDWKNLLFSCKTCNEQYKKTQFPICGTRARNLDDDLEGEAASLLNPASDNPEQVIGFDHSVVPGEVWLYGVGEESERGSTTVTVCGLNRPRLLKERGDARRELVQIARTMIVALENPGAQPAFIQKTGAQITRMTSSTSFVPFIGMRRAFFRSYDLGDFVAND